MAMYAAMRSLPGLGRQPRRRAAALDVGDDESASSTMTRPIVSASGSLPGPLVVVMAIGRRTRAERGADRGDLVLAWNVRRRSLYRSRAQCRMSLAGVMG